MELNCHSRDKFFLLSGLCQSQCASYLFCQKLIIVEFMCHCSGTSCSFTVPQGLWLTGPPLNGVSFLVSNIRVVFAKAYWLKPDCLDEVTPQVGGEWTHEGEWCSILHQVESRTFISYELHTKAKLKMACSFFCFFFCFFFGAEGFFLVQSLLSMSCGIPMPSKTFLNMYLIVTSASLLDSDTPVYVL